MKKLSIILLFISLVFVGSAQNLPMPVSFGRTTQEVGFTFGTSGDMFTTTPSYMQYWGIGKGKQAFKLGLGARLTSAYGSNDLEYITAPARFTSGKVGPSVFFADQIIANIDTVYLHNTYANALNVFFAVRYDFAKKMGLEFNIDLFGLGFGATKKATLEYNNGNYSTSNARPSLGNVLLISDNDLGTLNSELMLSYTPIKQLKLKAGISFLFTEYQLDDAQVYTNQNGLLIDNDVYRNKSLLFAVGANYILKKKITKPLY